MTHELEMQLAALNLELWDDRARQKRHMIANVVASAAGYLTHWAATGGKDARKSANAGMTSGRVAAWIVDNRGHQIVQMYERGQMDPKELASMLWDLRHAPWHK